MDQNRLELILKCLFLIVLYFLQGIPIGIVDGFSVLIQLKGGSYKDIGIFSFAFWPFSLKLLWAPLVDSIYIRRLGRRKSWLIPTQIILGLILIYISNAVDLFFENVHDREGLTKFTLIMTASMFFAATQDIAVDGWALTILPESDVALASACNSIGQTLGYLISSITFTVVAYDDPKNGLIRRLLKPFLNITSASLLTFYGSLFIAITVIVLIFVPETQEDTVLDSVRSIKQSYYCLWQFLKLRPVLILCFHLLIYRVGFAAMDALTGRKLLSAGVSQDFLSSTTVLLVVVQIAIPMILQRFIYFHGPMLTQVKVYFFKLSMNILCAGAVYVAYKLSSSAGGNRSDVDFPAWFDASLIFMFLLTQIPAYLIYQSTTCFFATVSDPKHGGAQMTLLNTVCNLGVKWSTSAALFLVDPLTFKSCKTVTDGSNSCTVVMDGFYVLIGICFAIGAFWYVFLKKSFYRLQKLPKEEWCI